MTAERFMVRRQQVRPAGMTNFGEVYEKRLDALEFALVLLATNKVAGGVSVIRQQRDAAGGWRDVASGWTVR